MALRTPSLQNDNVVAIDREIGSQYDNVRTVAENIESVVTVAGHIDNVDTVVTNIVDVHAVGGSIVDVRTVAANIDNVVAVDQNIANVNAVAANIDIIVTEVVPNMGEIVNSSANAAIATAKANEAATSAANALVSEQNAKASELAAGVSEDNAAASEAVAIAKAAEADASAIAAHNSELAAAAMLDAFDDRYLGSFVVDPVTDNDGQPLLDGALYFNTSANVLKVYDVGTTTWYTLPQTLLSSLLDVQLTSTTVGDMLSWNGAKWVNTSSVKEHITDTNNPHSVTKAQVGLSDVDNTADNVKNVATATKWATARTLTLSGGISGSATLDGSADATLAVTVANDSHTHAFANVTSRPTTISGYGITDAYTKTEINTSLATKVDKVLGKGLSTEDYTTAEKTKLSGIESGAQVNTVSSVAGKTGVVSLVKADVDLGNVDNTSDANKPVSTATQTALNLKANLDSPTLTGTPLAPTASTSTNTTQIATTAFVQAQKVDTVLTGTPTTPTAVVGTNTTQIASTAYVKAEINNETYSKTQLNAGQLDNRYYTETELNSGVLDTRYYTEAEIDTKLAAQNDASEIVVVPTGNLASTNVQAALVELQGDINNRYTKSETDTLLAGKVDDSEIASVNLLRADKYLAAQNVVNMSYNLNGKLEKVQYNNATNVDYEVLTYNVDGKLSNVAHYVATVLKGNTVLSYSNGKLVSAPYTAI